MLKVNNFLILIRCRWWLRRGSIWWYLLRRRDRFFAWANNVVWCQLVNRNDALLTNMLLGRRALDRLIAMVIWKEALILSLKNDLRCFSWSCTSIVSLMIIGGSSNVADNIWGSNSKVLFVACCLCIDSLSSFYLLHNFYQVLLWEIIRSVWSRASVWLRMTLDPTFFWEIDLWSSLARRIPLHFNTQIVRS